MESWQADYDKSLIASAERFGDTYEQKVECECGLSVNREDIHICEGCGEGQGCKHCLYWDPNWMAWFCGPDYCVRELERKLKMKQDPDLLEN